MHARSTLQFTTSTAGLARYIYIQVLHRRHKYSNEFREHFYMNGFKKRMKSFLPNFLVHVCIPLSKDTQKSTRLQLFIPYTLRSTNQWFDREERSYDTYTYARDMPRNKQNSGILNVEISSVVYIRESYCSTVRARCLWHTIHPYARTRPAISI